MRTAKKLTALLLAVVMVLAMSVSAFATDNSTATLKVSVIGFADPDRTVTLTGTTTVKDAIDQYASELAPVWKTVTNSNPNFGATAYVAETIYGEGTTPIGSDSGITAQFWSSQYPGYGIESTETTSEGTLYHYIYVDADITGADYVGGLFGGEEGLESAMNDCYLEDSFFYGKITATGEHVGGIIGWYQGIKVSTCISTSKTTIITKLLKKSCP